MIRNLRSVFAVGALVGLMVTAGCDNQEPDVRPRDFILEDLDGNEFQLSSTQGKLVVLHFFAPWCTVCQSEQPTLNAVHAAYEGRAAADVVVLGVAVQAESLEQIQNYKTTYSVPYRILIDNGVVAQLGYGVTDIPTTFFIDKEVNLVGPYGPMTEDELTGVIDNLLE